MLIRNHQDFAVCTTGLTNTAGLSAKPPPNSTPETAYAASAAAGRITACRIYHYHTPPFTQEDGFADYRDTGNGLRLLCYTHSYRISEQTARRDWFDAQGELACYDWFAHAPPSANIYAGTYPPNETAHLPENQIRPICLFTRINRFSSRFGVPIRAT